MNDVYGTGSSARQVMVGKNSNLFSIFPSHLAPEFPILSAEAPVKPEADPLGRLQASLVINTWIDDLYHPERERQQTSEPEADP